MSLEGQGWTPKKIDKQRQWSIALSQIKKNRKFNFNVFLTLKSKPPEDKLWLHYGKPP